MKFNQGLLFHHWQPNNSLHTELLKKEGRIQELGGLIYMIDISARGKGLNVTKCLFNNSQ